MRLASPLTAVLLLFAVAHSPVQCLESLTPATKSPLVGVATRCRHRPSSSCFATASRYPPHHYHATRRQRLRRTTTTAPQRTRLLVECMLPPHGGATTNNNTPIRLFSPAFFRSIDGIVFLTYFCNVIAMSLPILLVPMAAAEFADSSTSIASTVARMSGTATLGGALGKFLNGFICQAVGPALCSPLYLLLLATTGSILSVTHNPHHLALAYAGMEFCASMQWVALSVMLADHYHGGARSKSGTAQLAAALTALGLSSAAGQVFAKTAGAALVANFHWRRVARVGVGAAVVGALCVLQQTQRTSRSRAQKKKKTFSLQAVRLSFQAVLGSPLFWMLGFGHGMAFVTRGSDRILGTFYQHVVPGLSAAVAGGMTLAITLGLIRGLVVGSRQMVASASNPQAQQRNLRRWYSTHVVATIGLSVIALPAVLQRLPSHPWIRASLVGLLSACMASNVAYQFYQFPAMIAQALFRDHAAVTIGFLDGCGFLLSTPIFAATSAIVPKYGWSAAWAMMAALFAVAGVLMLRNVGPALSDKNAD